MKGVTTDHTGLERYRLSFCLCCSSNRDYLSLSSALLGWDTAVWTGSSAQGSTAAHRPSAPVPSQKETAQVCPTPTPTLHRHFPPATPQGHHPAPNSTSNPTELITTLSLATQDPKGLIKIPLVAKPWVRSDFISEISEPDWPKQPTCLNVNGTSERPAFLFAPRLNKPPKSRQCERVGGGGGGTTQTSRWNAQPSPPRGSETLPPSPASASPTQGAAAGGS